MSSDACARTGSAASEESLWPRYLLSDFPDAEDLEKYEPGGFHPVHLGDTYDDRYKIIHKLGSGGFSTVWLARDILEDTWVALKIVVAESSSTVETKSHMVRDTLAKGGQSPRFAIHSRLFYIQGPDGHHLCVVLPVLGLSALRLSHWIESRIRPRLCRMIAYQAAKGVCELDSQSLCHGGKP